MTLPTMVTGHFLPADIGARYTADTHVLVLHSCPSATYAGATQKKWTKTHQGLSRLTENIPIGQNIPNLVYQIPNWG